MGSKPRSCTEGCKRQVVDRAASSGRTATAVAAEVGLHPTLLRRRVRQHGTGGGKAEAARPATSSASKLPPVPTADQAAEVARLRRECGRLRMERDIPRKSIPISAGPLKLGSAWSGTAAAPGRFTSLAAFSAFPRQVAAPGGPGPKAGARPRTARCSTTCDGRTGGGRDAAASSA